MKTCTRYFSAAMALLLAAAVIVEAPTVALSAPATQPVDQIHRWFDELADNDPAVRESARVNLMGLTREQLEGLRQVVEQARPIAPAQAAALHQIVIQVFLASEPYENNARSGFLGVKLADVHQPSVTPMDQASDTASAGGVDAVMVVECVPGFCGFRYLRENDIVLGVIGEGFTATQKRDDLRDLVLTTPPGQTITLQIMRDGQVMRVAFKVDAQPRIADKLTDIEEFCNPRLNKAEDYWREKFAPLVKPSWS